MRLYVIRHADPDYPNKTITAAGHKEAAALAERMAREGLTHLYTSPLPRARHTAEYTAKAAGLALAEEEWVKEIEEFRIGKPPENVRMAWDIHAQTLRGDLDLFDRRGWTRIPPLDQPVFLEKYAAICASSDAFIARHGYVRDRGVYRIRRPSRDKVAVFCHGGLGLTWLAHLLEIPLAVMWAGFFLPPSSVTTILFDERTPELATPRCIGLGDVSHLYAAGLPVQPAGIKANFY